MLAAKKRSPGEESSPLIGAGLFLERDLSLNACNEAKKIRREKSPLVGAGPTPAKFCQQNPGKSSLLGLNPGKGPCNKHLEALS